MESIIINSVLTLITFIIPIMKIRMRNQIGFGQADAWDSNSESGIRNSEFEFGIWNSEFGIRNPDGPRALAAGLEEPEGDDLLGLLVRLPEHVPRPHVRQ